MPNNDLPPSYQRMASPPRRTRCLEPCSDELSSICRKTPLPVLRGESPVKNVLRNSWAATLVSLMAAAVPAQAAEPSPGSDARAPVVVSDQKKGKNMQDEARLRTWNAYQSAWGPIDEAKRQALLTESVSDDIAYADPGSQAQGKAELLQRIRKSQEQFPGARFQNDAVISHHDQALFQWTMYDGQGKVAVKGQSYARFGSDGRLVQATGFFKAPTK